MLPLCASYISISPVNPVQELNEGKSDTRLIHYIWWKERDAEDVSFSPEVSL